MNMKIMPRMGRTMLAVVIAGGLCVAASGAAIAGDGKGKGSGSGQGGGGSPNPYGNIGPTIDPNMPPTGGMFQPLCIGQMTSMSAGQITTGGPGGRSVDDCDPALDLGLDALLSQIPALAGGSPIPFDDIPTKPGKKGHH